jgi:hypothetical protein
MTARRPAAVMLLAFAVAIVAGTRGVRTDDPVSSNVRFTGDIVRILDRKCAPCHSDAALSIALSNYRDVRSWGRAIREEIVEQRMPPWTVARGYGRFQNDLSLTARETTTVLSWIDGGMPRGDDRDLPSAPHPDAAIAPDLSVRLPPQRIPALEDHLVRRVSIAIPVDPNRSISRLVLAPGARPVLRGALIFEADGDRTGQWVGAWLPWQHDTAPPAPHGFRLPRGARLIVELHYRGADRDVTDESSSIEVYYAPEASAPIGEVVVDGSAPSRLARNATVWAIVPSAGESASSLELTARRPDGSVQVLLWVPRLHREWPQALLLDRPLALPAGTALSLVAHPSDPSARARLSLLR